jgi:hypothetical protein
MPESIRSSLLPVARVLTFFLAILNTVLAIAALGALFVFHIDPRWNDLVPFAVAGGFGAAVFFWFLYFATLEEW